MGKSRVREERGGKEKQKAEGKGHGRRQEGVKKEKMQKCIRDLITFNLISYFQVYPGPVQAGKCTAEGEGLITAISGESAHFIITTRDSYKNRVEVAISDIQVHLEGPAAVMILK